MDDNQYLRQANAAGHKLKAIAAFMSAMFAFGLAYVIFDLAAFPAPLGLGILCSALTFVGLIDVMKLGED